MDKLQLRKAILDQIEKPAIPDLERSAAEFGAVPDSGAIQTGALQMAIDTVSREGGGRVVIPAGRYRTGALHIKSGVELHLESEKTVLSFVNENPELHYPVVFGHWEASPCYNFSSLIYACDAHDIAVTGKGTLDGGADRDHWWNWHHQVENAWSSDRTDLQLADRKALRQMNMDGVPLKERVFGPGHYLRPNFVQLIRCSRVMLQGITLKNSPMWQLNPVLCQGLTIDGVTLSSHGANNDGCDPESCRGVHIVNCRFDTGDDCISLKSGRDRDGREANVPCEYVLIENNDFADGHGGVALGSEMSGGIRFVLAWNNRFTSPNLTYALRLKTNARRGGSVEDIILADSVMDHVHGAAIHGTMLYEDGRNGSDLPVFRNITIENIKAHGGDYGIFLEAFEEVPVEGLVLRNIAIDGADRAMRGMNWKDPVVEHVVINGQRFPRPGKVRILGVPVAEKIVTASAEYCGGQGECRFAWEISVDGGSWKWAGNGRNFTVPGGCRYVRVTAQDGDGNRECSRRYAVISQKVAEQEADWERQRLICREILKASDRTKDETLVTREKLAQMLMPFIWAEPDKASSDQRESGRTPGTCEESDKMPGIRTEADRTPCTYAGPDKTPGTCAGPDRTVTAGQPVSQCLRIAVEQGFLAKKGDGAYLPQGYITRQEMATVAMQACGVNYRNASSTMPECRDADEVCNNYGTNVARALYFGFMEMGEDGCFCPGHLVTMGETVKILNRIADFAGI